jgi:transcriptional regulator with GAF, ATPase, and Fis domain
MEVYQDRRERPTDSLAGLVLLYAPNYAELQPAYPLAGEHLVMGREPPANLVIAQPAVSRSHAELRFDGQRWIIRDLGARNGTIVNGHVVHERALQHLDELRVGDAFFKFVASGAAAYLPYRIDGAVLNAPGCPSGIVGGYQLASICHDLERISQSAISVILQGESGAGKEVFARQIHAWSGRVGAFCALNCAAIPATLLESELFGYRRGAFSGADRDHVGLVRAADGGTLFLDEIGDMPPEAQAKLLRVLQTKEVLPLGATRPEQVDVRVVCATHRDLSAMQRDGSFRGDLFARLNEYSITLPPLRERKEDLFALCLAFLRMHKRPDLELSVPYMTGVLHYDWPYNVRELEALIKRGIALADGRVLDGAQLSDEIHQCMQGYGSREDMPMSAPAATQPAAHPPMAPYAGGWMTPGAATPQAAPVQQPLAQPPSPQSPPNVTAGPGRRGAVPGEQELRDALARNQGNVAAVGRQFGKERMQVHRWMRKYGIDPNDYR